MLGKKDIEINQSISLTSKDKTIIPFANTPRHFKTHRWRMRIFGRVQCRTCLDKM